MPIAIRVRYHIRFLPVHIASPESRFYDDAQIVIVINKRKIAVGFASVGVVVESRLRQNRLTHDFEPRIVTFVAAWAEGEGEEEEKFHD